MITTNFGQCLINEMNEDLSNRKTGIIFNRKYILAPGSILSNCINQRIETRLSNFELITVTPADNELYHKKFRVILKTGKNIFETIATVRCIFNCKRLCVTIEKVLIGMQSLSSSNSNDRLPISCFALFEFDKLLPNRIELVTQNFSNSSKTVAKLDEIYSVTTPFVNENFFNTINVGKIANILDENDCVMIGSMSLAHGCDGGGVYNREQ